MGMRKILLLLLFVGKKKKSNLKTMDPRNSSHYISLGKKLLVQHLIMEDLTYSVRVEPSKFSKMDKRGDVPCKGKMTQQKD